MSYSHAVDSRLAPAVQAALHRFAKPWYRLRVLHVFRDQTSLAMTPELWGSITSIGIFGVMAQTVAQQTPDIGIRMALGAQRRDVLHLSSAARPSSSCSDSPSEHSARWG
jgi:hypothetical protein